MTKRWVHEEMFSAAEVDTRIKEMADEVVDLYEGRNPLFVGILLGAQPFINKLVPEIKRTSPDFQHQLGYMTVSSYGNDNTAHKPRIVKDLPLVINTQGRSVVMLDEVLDKGRTAAFVEEHLMGLGAATVDLVALVEKIRRRDAYEKGAKIYGFESRDVWLVGMGMDNPGEFQEAHRWDPSISTAIEVGE